LVKLKWIKANTNHINENNDTKHPSASLTI
jgi:hypothetical protein